MQSFLMFFMVFMGKILREIEKGLYSKRKRLILKLNHSLLQIEKGYSYFTPLIRGGFWSPRITRKQGKVLPAWGITL